MKDARYKVDLSKRLDDSNKGAWLIKARAIAGKLIIVLLVYFAITYPWDKYNNEYLSLVAGIEQKQTEISGISAELDKTNQKAEALSKRYNTIAAMQKRRISWAKKLFNITKLIPAKVYVAEIGLYQAKDRTKKKGAAGAPLKIAAQKSVYIRGLIPALSRGEYLTKIVAMTKNINTDPEFTKDFYPMHLNYNKLVKLKQGEKEQELIEFELEAETK